MTDTPTRTPTPARTDRPAAATRLRGGVPAVVLILYFVFALFPMVWMLLLSLKGDSQQFTTHFAFSPTLHNYAVVLGLSSTPPPVPFTSLLLHSVIESVLAVAVSLIVGVPAAYAAARFEFRGKESLMFTILSFRFAPELMVIIPLYVIYTKLGLFDSYAGMVWVLQLVSLPFIVWILRSYFADLSPELEQAAMLDGYNRRQAFFKVALPLVKPGIAAVSLLAFIFSWNEFVFPLILTSSKAQTVTVGVTAFLGGNSPAYNQTAAAALVAVIPPLILALSIQRYLVRGLSFGAVKG